MTWVARGDVAPEAVREITAPRTPEAERAPGGEAVPPKDFKSFLLSMPDAGDDSMFERPLDYGRERHLNPFEPLPAT